MNKRYQLNCIMNSVYDSIIKKLKSDTKYVSLLQKNLYLC